MHKSLTTKQCKMIKDAKYSNDTNNNSSQISVFYTKIQKLKHHSSHRITQFNPMHTELEEAQQRLANSNTKRHAEAQTLTHNHVKQKFIQAQNRHCKMNRKNKQEKKNLGKCKLKWRNFTCMC